LADQSVDVLLDVFAPRNAPEFARVLKPGGRLLVVIPTARHLAELRQVYPLLAIQEDKRQAVETAMGEYFTLASAHVLTAALKLDAAAVADLVGMTPNAWFMTPENKQKLNNLIELTVTAEFEVLQFSLTSSIASTF
jgi:23S rRNA (guanine745-N1)-methyltransferase